MAGILARIFGNTLSPKGLSSAEPLPLQPMIIKVREKGSSGTELYSGYFSEDYFHELHGTRAADTYDKMRRNDGDVKMVVRGVKGPILAANWEVEPGGDSDQEKLHAEFIKHYLFENENQEWVELLGEALSCVEFGYFLFEITHDIVFNHPKFGTHVGLKKLGWRSPRTIETWNTNSQGTLRSVTQYAYGDLDRKVDIPAQFLLHGALEKEGDNYEGISVLRAAYGSWWRKQLYLKLMAIGSEKYAVPTPHLEIPANAQGTEQYNNAVDSLEAFVAHESQYITFPAGWNMEFLKSDFDPERLKICLDYESIQIARAAVMQFLLLGSGDTGSWALSTDLSDFALNSILHIAGRVEAPFNRKLIPGLVKANWGPQEHYPRLKASGIDDKAGKELAEVLKFFYESRYVTPDDDLEDHLRKRYRLPKRGKTGIREKPRGEGSEPGSPSAPPPPAAGGGK